MDGLFHGKPYEQTDDLGGYKTPIFGLTPIYDYRIKFQIDWALLVIFSPQKIGILGWIYPLTQDSSDHLDDISFLLGNPGP